MISKKTQEKINLFIEKVKKSERRAVISIKKQLKDSDLKNLIHTSTIASELVIQILKTHFKFHNTQTSILMHLQKEGIGKMNQSVSSFISKDPASLELFKKPQTQKQFLMTKIRKSRYSRVSLKDQFSYYDESIKEVVKMGFKGIKTWIHFILESRSLNHVLANKDMPSRAISIFLKKLHNSYPEELLLFRNLSDPQLIMILPQFINIKALDKPAQELLCGRKLPTLISEYLQGHYEGLPSDPIRQLLSQNKINKSIKIDFESNNPEIEKFLNLVLSTAIQKRLANEDDSMENVSKNPKVEQYLHDKTFLVSLIKHLINPDTITYSLFNLSLMNELHKITDFKINEHLVLLSIYYFNKEHKTIVSSYKSTRLLRNPIGIFDFESEQFFEAIYSFIKQEGLGDGNLASLSRNPNCPINIALEIFDSELRERNKNELLMEEFLDLGIVKNKHMTSKIVLSIIEKLCDFTTGEIPEHNEDMCFILFRNSHLELDDLLMLEHIFRGHSWALAKIRSNPNIKPSAKDILRHISSE